MRARVIRGGSWNNNRNNARCAVRNRNNPDNFNNNIGFRVVLSHNIFSRRKCRTVHGRRSRQNIGWPAPRSEFFWANTKPARFLGLSLKRANFLDSPLSSAYNLINIQE